MSLQNVAPTPWPADNAPPFPPGETERMAAQAAVAARLLKALAHEERLLALCRLMEMGEASAGALVAASGLGQSALSQHLALLRAEGLVETRRDGLRVLYRLASPHAARLLSTLHDLFCGAPTGATDSLEEGH